MTILRSIDVFKLKNCLFNDAVGEGLLCDLGGLEFGFKGVAEDHEFVDFGDDAALVFKRRCGNYDGFNLSSTQADVSSCC